MNKHLVLHPTQYIFEFLLCFIKFLGLEAQILMEKKRIV